MRSGQVSRQGFWCSTTGGQPSTEARPVVLQRVVELVWARRKKPRRMPPWLHRAVPFHGCAPRCLKGVKGGKTPSEYMFSALPQVADIARTAFDHLANPLVLQITAFWARAIPG